MKFFIQRQSEWHFRTLQRWLSLAGFLALHLSGYALGFDVPVHSAWGDRDFQVVADEVTGADFLVATEAALVNALVPQPQGIMEFSENKEEKNEGDEEHPEPSAPCPGPDFSSRSRNFRPGHAAPEVMHPRLYALYHSWKGFII